MKLQVVANLKLMDKVSKPYDLPKLDANGNEIGRNTGITNYISVKRDENGLIENIKLPSDIPVQEFENLVVGSKIDIVFEFETEPTAYIDKVTGKAKVNFSHVPKVVEVIPFKK